MTSVLDDAWQRLTAGSLAQWGNTSAYFNGSQVRVQLVAGAGTADNHIEIATVLAGIADEATAEAQCGPIDDRVSSNEPERGRLLDIGCTAQLMNQNACLITAGHCLSESDDANVVEFNVPLSNADGSIIHSRPEDQYALTNVRDFVDGGVGNDWGVFTVHPNADTGLTPFEAQGAHLNLSNTTPVAGDTIEVVGYGVDSGADNQTQQISFGPVTSASGTTASYQSDTEGGNSGSAVTFQESVEVVAIHSHGGCSTSGDGSNSGTLITHPDFVAAFNQICSVIDPPNGIQCGDIRTVRAGCRNGVVRSQVLMNNSDFSGQTLGFTLDGNPITDTVNDSQARLRIAGQSSGLHTLELVNPAGCFDPITVDCR